MRINNTDGINMVPQNTQGTTGVQKSIDVDTGVKSEIGLPTVSDKMVSESLQRVNKSLEKLGNTALRYSVHEKTHAVIVKVIDKSTNQVIREIPSEKILDVVSSLMELNGLLVDERR